MVFERENRVGELRAFGAFLTKKRAKEKRFLCNFLDLLNLFNTSVYVTGNVDINHDQFCVGNICVVL